MASTNTKIIEYYNDFELFVSDLNESPIPLNNSHNSDESSSQDKNKIRFLPRYVGDKETGAYLKYLNYAIQTSLMTIYFSKDIVLDSIIDITEKLIERRVDENSFSFTKDLRDHEDLNGKLIEIIEDQYKKYDIVTHFWNSTSEDYLKIYQSKDDPREWLSSIYDELVFGNFTKDHREDSINYIQRLESEFYDRVIGYTPDSKGQSYIVYFIYQWLMNDHMIFNEYHFEKFVKKNRANINAYNGSSLLVPINERVENYEGLLNGKPQISVDTHILLYLPADFSHSKLFDVPKNVIRYNDSLATTIKNLISIKDIYYYDREVQLFKRKIKEDYESLDNFISTLRDIHSKEDELKQEEDLMSICKQYFFPILEDNTKYHRLLQIDKDDIVLDIVLNTDKLTTVERFLSILNNKFNKWSVFPFSIFVLKDYKEYYDNEIMYVVSNEKRANDDVQLKNYYAVFDDKHHIERFFNSIDDNFRMVVILKIIHGLISNLLKDSHYLRATSYDPINDMEERLGMNFIILDRKYNNRMKLICGDKTNIETLYQKITGKGFKEYCEKYIDIVKEIIN